MLGVLPAPSSAVKDIRITTQDDLPGPDGDEPYTLFVNQTEYGNARFLRTNVLSARPDLKKYTALRFRQEVSAMPMPSRLGKTWWWSSWRHRG